MRRVALLLPMAALAGCVSTSGGQDAQAQFESFAGDAAAAQLVADECPSLSLRTSIEDLTRGFVNGLLGAGYSEAEINTAIQATSEERVVEVTFARMTAGGVRRGDNASLCQYGADQIAQGTRTGTYLR